MKAMKIQNFSTIVILLLVSTLLCGCGGSHKEKTILEHKHVFPEQKWNRFQEFKHEVEIKNTDIMYGISLEVVCTPDIETDNSSPEKLIRFYYKRRQMENFIACFSPDSCYRTA